MSLGLCLNWTRCPDGVEIFERELIPEEADCRKFLEKLCQIELKDLTTGKFVRFRSKAREELHLESTNHRNSLVLKFASANTEEKLQQFLSDYGMPHFGNPPNERTPYADKYPPLHASIDWSGGTMLEDILWHRAEILKLVHSKSPAIFANQFTASMEIIMQSPKNGQKPVLLLRPDTLFEYMKIEAASFACDHAEVATCPHCSSFFVTGGAKAKRTDSKYCSPRCRIATHRQRKKTDAQRLSKRTK